MNKRRIAGRGAIAFLASVSATYAATAQDNLIVTSRRLGGIARECARRNSSE